jgi:hypothetical protein
MSARCARMRKIVLLATVLSVATLGLQACFYGPSQPWRYGQYGQSQPDHTVCDVNGNNCLACDADNNNCRHVDTQYGANHTVCNDHGCMTCDARNTNCQSNTAKSSWGFFF